MEAQNEEAAREPDRVASHNRALAVLAERVAAGLVGWGGAAPAGGGAAPAEEHGKWWHRENYRASWRWHQYHPGCSEEDAKEYYRDWAACEQWHRRRQDRLRRDWGEAERWQRAQMLEAQRAEHEEAAAFRAQLDAARRNSFITPEAANAAEAAEAEMVEDAVRAAEGAEAEANARATLATIAALTAADAAEAAAAPAEAAAEAAAAGAACSICLEMRACTVLLNCCRQKMCLQCYTQVQNCPFCRAVLWESYCNCNE
jgi:hypothetical protein